MKRALLLLFISIHFFTLSAQDKFPENIYQGFFDNAYQQYPNIPRGFLEAFAWHNTRIQKIDPNLHSCTGKPVNLGVLGLIYEGQNYFAENGKFASLYSGFSINEMKNSPKSEILAFAALYSSKLSTNLHLYDKLKLLSSLSEIPMDNLVINAFAREAMMWEWIKFLNNPYAALNYGFEKYGIDEKDFFGDNYKIHSAAELIMSESFIKTTEGDSFSIPKSADYGPALWVAAPTCNYGSRNGTAVSAVTLHTVQGSYAGCISWFGNCSAGVSAHYVLRSSDGQVTQMVLESARAFHVGSENPYTIGLEHEGYVNNAAWYTTAMYQSSANLVKDIVASGYGINAIRTSWFPWAATTNYNTASKPGSCVRIKGHQHYPNQTHTDPGANWDWDYYFKLVHPTPTATIYTAASGTITDSGGSGNYANDERAVWTISPPNALSVTLNFTSFNLENTWDYLYVYNGNSVFSPLLGVFTGTNIPSTLVANSGSMTLEFRSDCATTSPGWEASWTSQLPGPVIPPDIVPPLTAINTPANWIVSDTLLNFADSDSGSGLKNTFYNVLYAHGNSWKGYLQKGFLFDDFETIPLSNDWTSYVGVWSSTGQNLIQSDEIENNTNIGIMLNQNNNDAFLYHFSAAYSGSQSNRRFGFHFMCDSVQKTNRGNSYFIWYRDMYQELEIYKVTNDVFSLVYDTSLVLSPAQFYDFKLAYSKITGQMELWVNNQMVARYTDSNPLQIGNAVSFRTGNALLQVSQIETYVARTANSSVMVEVGANSELPLENVNPSSPAGISKSIVSDQVGNLGQAQLLLNVDFSEPLVPQNLNDVNIADEDLIMGNPPNSYAMYWDAATDSNSGIAEYFVVLNDPQSNSFISVGSVLNYTLSGSFLLDETYKFGIYAVNNAGLLSDTVYSDGVKWTLPNSIDEVEDSKFKIYPNPSAGFISIESDVYPLKIWVFDLNGKCIYNGDIIGLEMIDLGRKLSNGQYLIMLESVDYKEVQKLIILK